VPNPRFQAARLTQSPRLILTFSLLLVLMAVLAAVGMMTVPWRQTVLASGQVSIFDPMQRPQPVDAQIKGRLVELAVVEGQDVKKGQLIAILEDRDSKFLDPQQPRRWQEQLRALGDKQTATRSGIEALRGQSAALSDAMEAALPAADAKAAQARQKLEVLRQQLRIGEQDVLTARLQKERIETLFAEGLRSQRDLELAVQKQVETETYLQKMQGDIKLAETDIELALLERAKTEADLSEKLQKVAESIAKAEGELAEVSEKMQKLQSEASIIDVRRNLQKILSPLDGRIIKLSKVGPGHMIKEGDTIATVVPPQRQQGVELFVKGLDTPLVEVGRPVRLMFEGFPAVPVVGWPWAAYGTFGGRVTVVDPIATSEEDKSGFRIWVEPDPAEPSWPSSDSLRIDSKVRGWIMLDDVPLYYEIWRQLNAFPARPALEGAKVKGKPVVRR
jgi:multidrug resistance efflux pump